MKTNKSVASKFTCGDIHDYDAEVMTARCIFIHGKDDFQRDRCFKHIIKKLNVAVNDWMQSFLYYGDEFSSDKKISQIIETLNSSSFIDETQKLVTIRYFEQLHKDAIQRIAAYTENPSPTNRLILIADKMDGKLSAVKTIIKNSLHLETVEMKYPKDLLQWLNTYIQEHRLRMDEQTKNYFTNTVELDVFTAYNEMKKLELYVGKTGTITKADIDNCTITSRKYNIYDFIDAVGYRQKQKALEIAEHLLDNGTEIIMILNSLSNFFFTLWRLDALRRKGITMRDISMYHIPEIVPLSKNHSFIRDKYVKFMGNFMQSQIQHTFKQLYIADCRIKLSMAKDNILLLNLIYQIVK